MISVIVPVRNAAVWIERCLRSALRQPECYELIVQDGASTDGTLAQIAAINDARISLVSEPDAGPDAAMQAGIRRCNCNCFIVLCADEMMLPGALSRGPQILRDSPELGVVYGDIVLTDLDGNAWGCYSSPALDGRFIAGTASPPLAAAFWRTETWFAAAPAAGWRRDCGEYELWMRCGWGRWQHFSQPVATYAVHPEQHSIQPENVRTMRAARAEVTMQLRREGLLMC